MKMCTKEGERTMQDMRFQANYQDARGKERKRSQTWIGFIRFWLPRNPEQTAPLILRTNCSEICMMSSKSSTHIAVGISVAAEHRPTFLDGATSTHMACM